MTASREIHLKSRPVGLPDAETFDLVTVEVAAPGVGEVQVKNLWMSVDPYMRGRMVDAPSYIPPFQIGEALGGGAIGEITISNDPSLKPGDLVSSMMGWREVFNAPAASLKRLETAGLPPEVFLSAAGGTGLTAYVGLLRIAALKEGDIVFVSGAAGAVGSMVCQIAKARGHKVIASAGGPEKIAYLKDELRVDEVIDYKAATSINRALQEVAPDGIDVFFDNVGGKHLEAALNAARPHARFALCGAISVYNATESQPGPRNMSLMMARRVTMKGFILFDHLDMQPAFLEDVTGWLKAGKIKSRETVLDGIDKAPEAFLGLFNGANIGKMLVKLG